MQPEFSTPTSRYLSRFGRRRAAKPPRSQPPYLSATRSQSLQAIRPLRAQSSVQTNRRAFDSGSDQRALINISRIVYCAAQCNRLRDWQNPPAENLAASAAWRANAFGFWSRWGNLVSEAADRFTYSSGQSRRCDDIARAGCVRVEARILAGTHLRLRRDFLATGPFRATANLLMANSSILRPSFISAVSHRGRAPRPAQVSPPGPRYFGATFRPFIAERRPDEPQPRA